MNKVNALEKLLDGAEFQWKPLDKLIVSLKTGLNPRQNFQLNTSDAEGYYVTVREIQNGEIVFLDKTDKVNKKALELINNRSNLEAGDILFSGTGTVGRTAVIRETPKNWNIKEGVYVIKPLHETINPRYLSHLLNSKNIVEDYRRKIVGSPVVSLPMSDLRKLKIPIPCPDDPKKSLAIQAEIVRILDAFTSLTAELTAELTARKKQYNHYRDQLLTFSDGDVEWRPLGEIVNTVTAPAKLKREAYREVGKTPIVDQGVDFIAGYTDENVKALASDEYVIFGDHSEHIKYVDFPFIQGADGLKILKPISDIPKYIYYALQNFYQKELNYKRHWSRASETLIPIPYADDPKKSLEEQTRIVAILDKFDALTNSLQEGLPREIDLRQKQYEYYRDMLLNFPKPEEEAA